MLRLFATIRKEYRLLFRDKMGLGLLFLMPVVLITVMALIQDTPFKDYQELKFDILTVDNDHGRLGRYIREGLDHSGQFRIVDSLQGQPVTQEQAKALVNRGDYKISIIIPQGATGAIVSNANKITNDLSRRMGLPFMAPVRLRNDSLNVVIYFDPAAKKAFKSAIHQALDNFLTQVETDLLIERIQQQLKRKGAAQQDSLDIQLKAIGLQEQSTVPGGGVDVISNSVQHNVPAWSIFAMFFIVIPIAGNMIREREDGSLLRMKLIPGSYLAILAGKMFFFVCICVVQFYLMMLVGIYLLPLLALPKLEMGHQYLPTLIIAACIGLAATAYGILIGTLFKTPNQALNFGAISIVILSAIGGIWIPLEVMPAHMQQIGRLSPLSWGLDAINNIYLRNGGMGQVWKQIGLLLGFAGTLLAIAGAVEKRRMN
ncbi:ABC-2 type transport system permease protein [Chitinophaga costaii]|uniref:ABC-2 type transport system permease protein n=1 Tax=Chitinophaga costaii TaxID=1335309 RepID=A0A1C4C2T8_9BACT|nr:ABC transporter permease [Chitinophaga costaii]PUZ27362.1 ABC transporter permease [Chitinophaga costaii]SCC13314.1 ABC-2 type transport system permease protein [Chitinophaga costaii]